MKKALKLFNSVRGKINKYWLAIIIFVIVTFLLGESSIFKRLEYDKQINRLESDIEHYKNQREENEKKLESLKSDNESLEKLAREQYQMTKENEDLFIIKD
ncbi:cell division protein DivIC [Dysgonomonadaceae bacterium PH5-43]|nr:cell division protein DivIC [Dysgonomonadaceae bacterium PH5-43]